MAEDHAGLKCAKDTLPVGSFTKDSSWAKAKDLGGNVREWTASLYEAYPGGRIDVKVDGERVVRGGNWAMLARSFCSSHCRMYDLPSEQRADLGFRCAVSL